MMTQVKSN